MMLGSMALIGRLRIGNHIVRGVFFVEPKIIRIFFVYQRTMEFFVIDNKAGK